MDWTWFITGVLGIFVMYLLYYLGTMNIRYWERKGVATIYTFPFIGFLYQTFRKGMSKFMRDIYYEFDGKRFGGYFQFTNPVLLLRDPELINQILIKDFIYFEDRGPDWKTSGDLFSLGLSNLTGDEWRTARHKLTPTFTSGKLKMMFEHISRCSDDVVSHLKSNLNKDFNAKDLGLRYIINVIASVAFGLDINTLEDGKDNEFYRVSAKFFKPSMTFLLKLMIAMLQPKIRDLLRMKLIDDDVDKFFRKLTFDVIKYRETSGTRRNDFLQLMLDQREKEREFLRTGQIKHQDDDIEDPDDTHLLEQLKNTPMSNNHWNNSTEIFTNDFIASQTFLFISGGSETTATVLSFILYELAINKTYQKKVQQEIEDVLSTNDFNYQAIKKMTYMDQFVYESMRCHPFTGGLMRMCTKDYKIPGTDIILEKGTFAFIPIGCLHKDPQYFADPEKFDPGRFEDMDTIPKGVFFSFGDGPRMCIAMRLAILEMKVFLAKLLLNYDIVLSEKTQLPLTTLKHAFMLNVEGGLWVKFNNRQN